jgi:hypothetical protein
MSTSLDTNVLVALWDANDALHRAARAALDQALARGALVISGVVYAELLAAPRRDERFLNQFREDTGIQVEWEFGEAIWRAAGQAFRGYTARRKRQGGSAPRQILTDFLIGAHALVNGHRLLTLDEKHYRAAFPKLELLEA